MKTIDKAIVAGNAEMIFHPDGFANGWRVRQDGIFCSECRHRAQIIPWGPEYVYAATDWCGHCGGRLTKTPVIDHHGEQAEWKRRRRCKFRCSRCGAARMTETNYCTMCGAKITGGHDGRIAGEECRHQSAVRCRADTAGAEKN